MGCVATSAVATIPMDEVQISIFGLDNAGKTCFLRALTGDFNFDSVPSVGMDNREMMYDDTKIKIYDLGGNQNFRSIWKRFFAEIWGYIYVVDAADPDRFKESKETLKEMMTDRRLRGKPFIVVANKQDKEGAANAKMVKKALGLPKDVEVFEATAIEVGEDNSCNQGVSDAVSELIVQILKKHAEIARKREKDMEEQRIIEEREREEKKARILKRRQEEEERAQELEANEQIAA